MDIPLQSIGKDIRLGKVVIEQIILISNKKIPKDAIKYLQIHLHKVPNRAITETSSGRIPPLYTEASEEVSFLVPAEDRDIFLLHFRPDVLPEVDQFQIHLQVKKKGKSQIVGAFGICYNDLQLDCFSQKMKTRHLQSQWKNIAEIEIKYKVEDCSRPAPPPETVVQTAASHPPNLVLPGPDLPLDSVDDTLSSSPEFRADSCIVVLGTTGRGKTTTMNLYTGNTAATKAASHGTTSTNSIYRDLNNPHYPVWLDTVGLDEADAATNNSDLVRSYLLRLQSAKVRWVHAVIWCITPEDKKLQYLKDQAKVIRSFGNNSTRIWGNVIIIAKQGNATNQDSFQGALAAISDLEGGHRDIVESVQCLQYDLNTRDSQSRHSARNLLHRAFSNITTPVQVVFSDQVCLDCGQRGDERLLSDLCHDTKLELPRQYFSSLLPAKTVCSHCRANWSRNILGFWSFTSGRPCVRIRNKRDIKEGESLSETKTRHNMMEKKPIFGAFTQCSGRLD